MVEFSSQIKEGRDVEIWGAWIDGRPTLGAYCISSHLDKSTPFVIP